jgi:hypothetical protein
LDTTGLGQGPVAGCCECGDEPSGSCATELVKNGKTVRMECYTMEFWKEERKKKIRAE